MLRCHSRVLCPPAAAKRGGAYRATREEIGLLLDGELESEMCGFALPPSRRYKPRLSTSLECTWKRSTTRTRVLCRGPFLLSMPLSIFLVAYAVLPRKTSHSSYPLFCKFLAMQAPAAFAQVSVVATVHYVSFGYVELLVTIAMALCAFQALV